MNLSKAFNLELYKLKHKYFFLSWLLLTVAPLAYLLYNLRTFSFSPHIHYASVELVYFYEQSEIVWLLALILPVMASLLISKLIDLENKNENWRLLITANEDFKTLWSVKFLTVFFLMELTTLLFYLTAVFRLHQILGAPIPVGKLLLSFIGLSGANVMTLTIAQGLAVFYRNQAVVLIEGLFASFIALISPLMPRWFCYLLPWGYYALNILATNESLGRGSDGIMNWKIIELYPNYVLIFGVALLFIAANVALMRALSKREI